MQPFSPLLDVEVTAKTCRQCGDQFELPTAFLAKYVDYCPTCTAEHDRAQKAQAAADRAERRRQAWQSLCPPDYADSDPARLPRPAMLATIMNWTFGPRGLLLHGESGLGKSRCAWLLLHREFDRGRWIQAIDYSFGLRWGGMFTKSAGDAEAWIQRLTAADILLVDDTFKSRLTDSAEAALFAVVAGRCEAQRPTITATNDSSDSLRQRLSGDRADALLRRLMEYSTPVAFV